MRKASQKDTTDRKQQIETKEGKLDSRRIRKANQKATDRRKERQTRKKTHQKGESESSWKIDNRHLSVLPARWEQTDTQLPRTLATWKHPIAWPGLVWFESQGRDIA
jgi:hypothetical protein